MILRLRSGLKAQHDRLVSARRRVNRSEARQLARKVIVVGIVALIAGMGGLGWMLKQGWPGPPDRVLAALLLGGFCLWLAGELKCDQSE